MAAFFMANRDSKIDLAKTVYCCILHTSKLACDSDAAVFFEFNVRWLSGQ